MAFHFFLLLIWLTWSASTAAAASLALPGCQEKCGNVSIPYPFGIGVGCYRNQSGGIFEIFCNDTSRPPRPFILFNTLEIIQIEASLGVVHVRNFVDYDCFNGSRGNSASIGLEGTPFAISATRNKFFSVGCGIATTLWICNKSFCFPRRVCFSSCSNSGDEADVATCNDYGCCSSDISKHLKSYYINIVKVKDEYGLPFNTCGYAFIADQDSYRFSKTDLSDYENFNHKIRAEVPVVLDWVVGNETK